MKEREIFGFDTEDHGHGDPYFFALAGARGTYRAHTRTAFLEKLLEVRDATPRPLELWATNLAYDLVNVFGRERIAEVSLSWGRADLVRARWRGIEFRDTIRHLPASVEDLGELVGLEKIMELGAARGVRDASITRRFALKLSEIYGELGIRARTTLAATAYALWKERHWKAPVWRPRGDVWRAALESYYGGRTEPFALGRFRTVHVADVASMFPWAMTAAPLPLPWGACRWIRRPALKRHGIFYARVRSELDVPLLPYRSDDGLCFPNGRFEGWWTGEELAYFAACGGQLELLEGYVFAQSCDPFSSYVRQLFERKARSRGPAREIYKTLLNALYGKFSQQGTRIHSLPLEKFMAYKGSVSGFRVWNGIAIWREEADPPPWGNNVWPAFVTARARIALHRELSRIRAAGRRLLYCDTDSILYTGDPMGHRIKAERPGDFEHRETAVSAWIVGRKEYGLELEPGVWDLMAKGIPESQRAAYLETGRARFKRPTKLREAMAGRGEPNQWTEHKKERRVSYGQGRRQPDGDLVAPVIRAGSR